MDLHRGGARHLPRAATYYLYTLTTHCCTHYAWALRTLPQVRATLPALRARGVALPPELEAEVLGQLSLGVAPLLPVAEADSDEDEYY